MGFGSPCRFCTTCKCWLRDSWCPQVPKSVKGKDVSVTLKERRALEIQARIGNQDVRRVEGLLRRPVKSFGNGSTWELTSEDCCKVQRPLMPKCAGVGTPAATPEWENPRHASHENFRPAATVSALCKHGSVLELIGPSICVHDERAYQSTGTVTDQVQCCCRW